ncbi:hypothetical protein pb186bvf_012999 [Paramecium bursaria]
MDGSEWSFDNLNSICWAIGSLSGCLPEGEEKPFLVQTIKNLLSLCESKKGKENKAVVASNIMYVVGQYPKFLKINWNFLKTVIKKLFEFMIEQFPGVQEMACNTFLTVSKKCGQQFVVDQSASDPTMKEPYIYELIRSLPDQIKILSDAHLLIYIEGLGYMIKEDENFERRVQFSIELLKNYQETYTQYYLIAQQSIDNIREDKFQKFLINYLRIAQRAVQPIGFAFYQQLLKMLPTLNEYYALYTQILLQQINTVGIHVLNYFTFKQIRQVRRETLKLYTAFFNASDQKEINSYQNIKEHIVGPICNLLEDYKQCIHEIKEPELLLTFTSMIEKLTTPIQELVPLILANIFQSTISLISQDFNSYPDHRINFFEFLKACVLHHFSALFTMPQEQFRLMIDCIIWAFKHQVPNLQELGLDLMFFILKNLNQSIEIANQFYFIYYKRLLQDIWEILTDSLHTSTFKLQAQILQLLFQVAASPEIVVALDSDQQLQNQSNLNHISQYLVVSLSTTFQTISQQQTAVHINRMFQNRDDSAKFRVELSDYLINLRQYAQNNDHLQTSQQAQGQQSID